MQQKLKALPPQHELQSTQGIKTLYFLVLAESKRRKRLEYCFSLFLHLKLLRFLILCMNPTIVKNLVKDECNGANEKCYHVLTVFMILKFITFLSLAADFEFLSYPLFKNVNSQKLKLDFYCRYDITELKSITS